MNHAGIFVCFVFRFLFMLNLEGCSKPNARFDKSGWTSLLDLFESIGQSALRMLTINRSSVSC